MNAPINVVISGSGLFTPEQSISNDELVKAFNAYVERYNQAHAAEIEAGTLEPLQPSSSEFIVKASGIHSRYVIDKQGILDPEVMAPQLPERADDELSILAEMGVKAARQALERAGRSAGEVDLVIVACSNLQRAYPAIAIEIQQALGCQGFGYDMNVACSSATFGIGAAADAIRSGSASRALVINPEICSGHLEFRDRDCHFIFGDVATAVLLEPEEQSRSASAFRVLGTHFKTRFSNNIRNNFGFLNRTAPQSRDARDKLFRQEGRKVFKELLPLVTNTIGEHLDQSGLQASDFKRFWLHQANLTMNMFAAKKLLGREPSAAEVPIVLDRYANTSSAGSIIAFHLHSDDLSSGDRGLLSSFGAGYSVGSVLLQKI
ncbi:beta-ketoacyl-ACP synthase III [Motiliproteus sediminis]|uniref:beta-ketoacyl-ACP synthase III n=1 Tax=Motiliproteus sediminis TaxID=1468178 RepID=UPI001AEF7F3C|nr:beta-ketoacyl-ACP synthase III [Motiliproteus sediminis]